MNNEMMTGHIEGNEKLYQEILEYITRKKMKPFFLGLKGKIYPIGERGSIFFDETRMAVSFLGLDSETHKDITKIIKGK